MGKTKHGLAKTRFYNIWQGMRQRCNNPNHDAYNRYGGRGITYDPKWDVFSTFYNDMKKGYKDYLTLDRIENNGNYCKSNCKWSTKKEQSNNTRLSINPEIRKNMKIFNKKIRYYGLNKLIVHNGVGKTLSDWCRFLNIPYSKVSSRIGTCGYTRKQALGLE